MTFMPTYVSISVFLFSYWQNFPDQAVVRMNTGLELGSYLLGLVVKGERLMHNLIPDARAN